MSKNVFQKITDGEIPSFKVFESEKFIAILDIFPITNGQIVVFPKSHYDYVWDIPQAEYIELMLLTKKLVPVIKDVTGYKMVASHITGIDVPHAHVVLIPFNSKEDILSSPPKTPIHSDILSNMLNKYHKILNSTYDFKV